MAGVSRLQYSADIELIRVMCSGRVDLEFIFRAFAQGMDGVLIGGCRLGECNYITHGNYRALNTVLLCKRIMAHVGLDPERLTVEFMSSGEGQIFAEKANEFSHRVAELGPLGEGEGLSADQLRQKLDAVIELIPYIKIASNAKLGVRVPADQRDQFFSDEEIDGLFGGVAQYVIDPEKCRACMICARRCPAQAISGGKNQAHVIQQDKCIKCGTCLAACPPRFGAIRMEQDPRFASGLPGLPDHRVDASPAARR